MLALVGLPSAPRPRIPGKRGEETKAFVGEANAVGSTFANVRAPL